MAGVIQRPVRFAKCNARTDRGLAGMNRSGLRKAHMTLHIVDELIHERAPKLVRSPAWPVVRPVLYTVLGRNKAVRMADAIAGMAGPEALDYVSNLLSLVALPGDHEIRPQAHHCLDARIEAAPDRGQVRDLRRDVVARASDDLRRRADGDECFHRARDERDDALRGRVEMDVKAGVVGDVDARRGGGARARRIAGVPAAARAATERRRERDDRSSNTNARKHKPVLAQ